MHIPQPDIANAGLLALAIGALFAFNFLVDPFQANDTLDLGLEKRPVSYKLSYQSWGLAEYRKQKQPVILLGDSRMNNVKAEYVSDVLGKEVYNLSFGGGTMADMVSSFWFARSQGKLEQVYFGLAPRLLNEHNRYDRAKQAVAQLNSPVRYYFAPFTTEASVRVLLYNLGSASATSETPPMDEDAFWDYQLKFSARKNFRDYVFPKKFLSDIENIVRVCAEDEIEIRFVVFPVHQDLHARMDELGASDDYRRAKMRLAELTDLVDFDDSDELILNRENFRDPFHTIRELQPALVDEFVGGKKGFGKWSQPPSLKGGANAP